MKKQDRMAVRPSAQSVKHSKSANLGRHLRELELKLAGNPYGDLNECFRAFQQIVQDDIDSRRHAKWPTHRTTELYHPAFGTVHIDCRIAPLVQQIWAAQMYTFNSCEDNIPAGYVWIQFACFIDIESFLSIVLGGENESSDFYRRVTAMRARGSWGKDEWRYSTSFDRFDGMHFISVSVRFPRRDLSRVYRKVYDHNRVAERNEQDENSDAENHPKGRRTDAETEAGKAAI
ncbi:MAG: hypothetical protein JNM27_11380 [Leptospirales bacterium]|nr:hypothetical protein [Leptospirales bacterium]